MKRPAYMLTALSFSTLALAGCGGGSNSNASTASSTDTTLAGSQTAVDTSVAAKHHSVLGGALAGAAAGHVLGKHAIAGAAVGALVQHERNKHEAAAQH